MEALRYEERQAGCGAPGEEWRGFMLFARGLGYSQTTRSAGSADLKHRDSDSRFGEEKERSPAQDPRPPGIRG